MLRDCPYSTKTREVLGNPSPPPSRFPSTLEISLGLRPREISRVSGNLSGVGDGFPNTSRVLMDHGYTLNLPMAATDATLKTYFPHLNVWTLRLVVDINLKTKWIVGIQLESDLKTLWIKNILEISDVTDHSRPFPSVAVVLLKIN